MGINKSKQDVAINTESRLHRIVIMKSRSRSMKCSDVLFLSLVCAARLSPVGMLESTHAKSPVVRTCPRASCVKRHLQRDRMESACKYKHTTKNTTRTACCLAIPSNGVLRIRLDLQRRYMKSAEERWITNTLHADGPSAHVVGTSRTFRHLSRHSHVDSISTFSFASLTSASQNLCVTSHPFLDTVFQPTVLGTSGKRLNVPRCACICSQRACSS